LWFIFLNILSMAGPEGLGRTDFNSCDVYLEYVGGVGTSLSDVQRVPIGVVQNENSSINDLFGSNNHVKRMYFKLPPPQANPAMNYRITIKITYNSEMTSFNIDYQSPPFKMWVASSKSTIADEEKKQIAKGERFSWPTS
jgi:hypothetical protein